MSVLEIALVESAAGEILWANTASRYGSDFTIGQLEGMVERVFDPFPGDRSDPS
jgi:hypothetical protein